MDPRARGMRKFMGSFSKDQSLKNAKIERETFKRILRFAAPYKGQLIIFLIFIIFDAAIGVVNPLLYKQIIDNGIIEKNTELIVRIAFLVGFLSITDAALSFFQRYFSARIGEGLIFDMRTKVFSHIQQSNGRQYHFRLRV